jgi:hypothetical protein
MCAGNFINSDGLRRFETESKRLAGSYKLDSQQVLLAGQDGSVYIMIDFEVIYANERLLGTVTYCAL